MIYNNEQQEFYNQVKNLVMRSSLEPVAFYPGSDADIMEPLLLTNFSRMICVDSYGNPNDIKIRISEELERTAHSIVQNNNQIRVNMDIHGVKKEVELHFDQDVHKMNFRKLPAFDVVFSNGLSIDSPVVKYKAFAKLKNKGLFITNTDSPLTCLNYSEYFNHVISSKFYNVYLKKQNIPLSVFKKDHRTGIINKQK